MGGRIRCAGFGNLGGLDGQWWDLDGLARSTYQTGTGTETWTWTWTWGSLTVS